MPRGSQSSPWSWPRPLAPRPCPRLATRGQPGTTPRDPRSRSRSWPGLTRSCTTTRPQHGSTWAYTYINKYKCMYVFKELPILGLDLFRFSCGVVSIELGNHMKSPTETVLLAARLWGFGRPNKHLPINVYIYIYIYCLAYHQSRITRTTEWGTVNPPAMYKIVTIVWMILCS